MLPGRSGCRFPKSQCECLETLDGHGSHNRVPVLEMRIEDGLTMFDFLGQAADRHSTPSFALRNHLRCCNDAMLALGPLPLFPLGDTQSSISQS